MMYYAALFEIVLCFISVVIISLVLSTVCLALSYSHIVCHFSFPMLMCNYLRTSNGLAWGSLMYHIFIYFLDAFRLNFRSI